MRALGLVFLALVTLSRPARAQAVATAIDLPSWAVNAVLGDQTWTGPGPAALATPEARITAHLRRVVATLRAADVRALSASAQDARHHLLVALAGYAEAGVFPRRTDDAYPGWRPRFIDDRGVACAVGFLLIASGHGALALEIDARAEYAYVRELAEPRLRAWADTHGFTVDELAMIQPRYHPPATPAAVRAGLEYEADRVTMACAPAHGPRAQVRVKVRVARRGRPSVRVVGTDAFARCATRTLQEASMISPRGPDRPFRVEVELALPTLEEVMTSGLLSRLVQAGAQCWPAPDVGRDARATIAISSTATVTMTVAGKDPDTEYCLTEALRPWAARFVSAGPAFTITREFRLGPPAPR